MRRSPIATSLMLATIVASSCGKKDDDSKATNEDELGLETSTEVLNFALSALSSAGDPEAAALRLNAEQSADFPECSTNGEPWDSETNDRWSATKAGFGQATMKCQLKSSESPDTVRGSLEQPRKILCDLDRIAGGIEYAEGGKVYEDFDLMISTGCGWDEEMVEEISAMNDGAGLKATVTATSFTKGDWQRKVEVEVPGLLGFTIYMTIDGKTLSIKQIEEWRQEERCEREDGGSCNQAIASDAVGLRGSVITLDLDNGTMWAESGDTYWSRRGRFLVKGTIDEKTGAFSSITSMEGFSTNFGRVVQQNFTGLYGETVSVSGSVKDGLAFRTGKYSCSGSCIADVRAGMAVGGQNAQFSDSGVECSVSGGCSGNEGFEWKDDDADQFDFLMLGADWDAQGSGREDFVEWLEATGPLSFEAIKFSTVIE